MPWPIVTVPSGGLPVTEATNGFGIPVQEATNGFGIPVTFVDSGGLPVDNPYGNFLFYEDNQGSLVALNGHKPPKGAAHFATGGAGAGMTIGNGQMKQAAADGTAGYDIVNQGVVPRKIVGEWLMASGDFTYPATIAICKDTSIVPMLHGQGATSNFYFQMVAAGPTFIDPLYRVTAANWSALSTATRYRDELHYNGGKMAAMVKRSANGAILGQQLSYDFRMPDYAGTYSFWQTLTARIRYLLQTAEATSDYAFPAVTELAALANPSTSQFVATAFGGTLTNSGSGLIIGGASYGNGGQITLGAVASGDSFDVGFDAASFSGGSMEVALLKNGAVETEKSNVVYFTGAGRVTARLTATEAMAGGASVAIVMSPAATGAGGCTVSNLQIVKGLPASL